MGQFIGVSSRRGAPLGRPEFGVPEGPAALFRVRLVDGDYDDGGAYWGGPPALPLYCLRTRGSEHFYWASNRRVAAAGARAEFPGLVLKRGEP